MKNYFDLVCAHPIFDNITREDFNAMFNCISAFEKSYAKNEYILHLGDKIDFVGIVISGEVRVMKSDENGNETIIAEISDGDIFLEVFACADIFQSPVSIVAGAKSRVLFLDYRKIVTTCSSSCRFHQTLISNMLKVIARKSLYLNQKIDIISKKTLREKIMAYFNYSRRGAKKFTIELNREQLASFLCADRSALSNELSKMQKEGIIKFSKNEFEILL